MSTDREQPTRTYPDGYQGLDWELHSQARAGVVGNAVGPGLVQYGLWMHVVQSRRPQPAQPGTAVGAVLQ